MEIPNGYGYQGVVMYDDVADLVQCAICGKWKRSVGSHCVRVHGVNRDEYKMRFGLALKTALCSKDVSSVQSRNIRAAINDGRVKLQICKLKRNLRYRRAPRQTNKSIIQIKNKSGLCELQMRTRYEVVKKIVGREPKQLDIVEYDPALAGGIHRVFGNINNYRKHLGLKPKTMEDYRTYEDLDIVAALRRFAKNNHRTPRPADFQKSKNGYPHFSSIYDRFGSWSNALITSGL